MKKFISTAVVCWGIATSALAQDGHTIRVASDGALPPFDITLPDGTLSGFNVDVMRAICDEQQMDCEFVKQEWDGMIPGLLANKFDVVASMSITDERRTAVSFSNPTHQKHFYFVGRTGLGNVDVSKAETFDDLTVGVERGSAPQCYFENTLPDVPLKVYPAIREAIMDMKSGRLDVVIGNTIHMNENLIEENPGEFQLYGDVLKSEVCFGEGSGPAVRQGEDQLTAQINAGIAAIYANGTFEEINAKYFDEDISVVLGSE